MLVLSRHKDESITIGGTITIKILGIHGNRVRVGIEAPKDIPVYRTELNQAILTKEQLNGNQEANPSTRQDHLKPLTPFRPSRTQ